MFFNFFKKEKVEQETYEDKQLIRLLHECYKGMDKLEEQVLQTIITNNTIELYFDDDDKNKAIKNSEHEKRILSCYIAEYNLKRLDYISYFEETINKRVTTKNYIRDVIESHKVIERIYKKYFIVR